MSCPEDRAREAARAFADQMRVHRAWLAEEVASGTMTLDGLFEEQASGGWSPMVRVVVLAEKVPGVGKVRARRAMEQLGIAEDARWGEVEPATIRALWSAMADAATRPISEPPGQSSASDR